VIIHSKRGVEIGSISAESRAADMLDRVIRKFKHLASIDFKVSHDLKLSDQLIQTEEKLKVKHYKFGIICVKNNQTKDDEYYGNKPDNPDFDQFLSFIGTKIDLQGWTKYSGGLDTKKKIVQEHSQYSLNLKDMKSCFMCQHYFLLIKWINNKSKENVK